jgi:hypothetical protein
MSNADHLEAGGSKKCYLQRFRARPALFGAGMSVRCFGVSSNPGNIKLISLYFSGN